MQTVCGLKPITWTEFDTGIQTHPSCSCIKSTVTDNTVTLSTGSFKQREMVLLELFLDSLGWRGICFLRLLRAVQFSPEVLLWKDVDGVYVFAFLRKSGARFSSPPPPISRYEAGRQRRKSFITLKVFKISKLFLLRYRKHPEIVMRLKEAAKSVYVQVKKRIVLDLKLNGPRWSVCLSEMLAPDSFFLLEKTSAVT